MPTPETILAGLRLASGRFIWLAVVWHLVTLLVVVGLIRGSRPSRRIAAVLAALALVSASAVAFAVGNPFNGSLLGASGVVLVALGWRVDRERLQLGSSPARAFGAAMIAFAWTYPHFLEELPATTYLWAAPMGVIPCPTLSLSIGFALLFHGFASRAWSLVLATVGLFYGLFGVVRLGVVLDLGLVAGACALWWFAASDLAVARTARRQSRNAITR